MKLPASRDWDVSSHEASATVGGRREARTTAGYMPASARPRLRP
jgi:hypothetical protein